MLKFLNSGGVTHRRQFFEQILSTAAALIPTVGNFISQQRTNEQSWDMSQEQMEFQREMSSTAHRREVQDLQLAGLNPQLSAGGNGSSTPSGSTPNLIAPQINMPDIFGNMMSLKNLDLAEQKVGIDKANSAAAIAKSLSETELNKMKKILSQKGIIRAEMEGEGASILKDMIRGVKKWYYSPSVPKMDSPNIQNLEKFNRMP